jgi:hypothetical protein
MYTFQCHQTFHPLTETVESDRFSTCFGALGAHTRLKFPAGIVDFVYYKVNTSRINNLAHSREYSILAKLLIKQALTVNDT